MQKQVKLKNVARYLKTAATQMQLAQHLYKNSQSAERSATYVQFAASNAQAIKAKYAHIVANAQQYETLIIAQCLHNSSVYNNAVADLYYIKNVHNLIQA